MGAVTVSTHVAAKVIAAQPVSDPATPAESLNASAEARVSPAQTAAAEGAEGKPLVVEHDTDRQAKRAADREAGIGKHGAREPIPDEGLREGSQAGQGDPGTRTSYRNPENGAVVHNDPYGHDYGDGNTIGPHWGVTPPPQPGVKTKTTHHTYPPPATKQGGPQ